MARSHSIPPIPRGFPPAGAAARDVNGNGTAFVGNGSLWHSGFAFGNEIPFVGDVNADGFGDLVLFQQDTGEVRLSRAVP